MPAARAATKSPTKKTVPSPQEIAPGVFLGGWNDALTFTGAKFCLLDEAPEEMPTATHIPIYDEGKDAPVVANLDRLVTEVRSARRAHEPVLIFCGHGVRRGPLGAAWYLHRSEKLPLDAAYDRIRAVRPKIETASEWIGHPQSLDG
ncbi:MAG TPA: dual specificity protein phosphatase family protein [Thermoplasmata archaeon]|nr:dual specificity protein phosphatase family protein [Thermoplasmata archaeon]